jgi:hypothetical protein
MCVRRENRNGYMKSVVILRETRGVIEMGKNAIWMSSKRVE